MYYQSRDRWIDVMRHAIALNASFFNTHRMVQQYAANAYVRWGTRAKGCMNVHVPPHQS